MHSPVVTTTGRDLRLDLFRGLALWLIFLDHIPSNIVSWITIRNYGFSDATEIFIFISGYTAAFVYGRAMRERGFVVAGARILQARLADLRRAHLSVRHLHGRDRLRRGELRKSALRRGNEHPRFPQAARRHDRPGAAAQVQAGQHGRAAALYRAAASVSADPVAAAAAADAVRSRPRPLLYALTWQFDWNLPAYPSGVWFFNPFAWQLLFVFGAWCALGGAHAARRRSLRSPSALALAVAYLVFAFVIALTLVSFRARPSCRHGSRS